MSSLLFIVIRISKFLLLRAAKAVGDRVVFLASDSHIAALKFLNPQSYDLREIPLSVPSAVMNWVTTVNGLVESTVKLLEGPKNVLSPKR